MKTYRWGIIGPGKIAHKFASAIPLANGASLAAVASRDIRRAREFAGKFSVEHCYDSYEMLAKDPAIDAVYVATPHGFHAEHSLLCLRHGKAVLCEKPMALSQKQVRCMIEEAQKNKVFLMEAMWTRFLPVIEKTLELIGNGEIGEVKQVIADFGFHAPFHPDHRLYNLRLGGGSLLDIGIYPIFLCLLLLGEPAKISAMAHLASTGADESCEALFGYPDGRSALFSSTLACRTPTEAVIAGTGGIIKIPGSWFKNDHLILQKGEEAAETICPEPVTNGFEFEIRETMACLDKGLIESPRMPHAFSLMMSRVMDKIREQCGIMYEED